MFVVQLVLCFYVTMSLEKKQFCSFDCLCHPREPEIACFFFPRCCVLAIREVCIEAGAVLGNVQAFASKLVNAHPPMPLLHETNNFQTMTLQKKTRRDM